MKRVIGLAASLFLVSSATAQYKLLLGSTFVSTAENRYTQYVVIEDKDGKGPSVFQPQDNFVFRSQGKSLKPVEARPELRRGNFALALVLDNVGSPGLTRGAVPRSAAAQVKLSRMAAVEVLNAVDNLSKPKVRFWTGMTAGPRNGFGMLAPALGSVADAEIKSQSASVPRRFRDAVYAAATSKQNIGSEDKVAIIAIALGPDIDSQKDSNVVANTLTAAKRPIFILDLSDRKIPSYESICKNSGGSYVWVEPIRDPGKYTARVTEAARSITGEALRAMRPSVYRLRFELPKGEFAGGELYWTNQKVSVSSPVPTPQWPLLAAIALLMVTGVLVIVKIVRDRTGVTPAEPDPRATAKTMISEIPGGYNPYVLRTIEHPSGDIEAQFQAEAIIGRGGPDAISQKMANDGAASRNHARIFRARKHSGTELYFIEDCQSTNGTSVEPILEDGRLGPPVVLIPGVNCYGLHNGDVIAIGDTRIVFEDRMIPGTQPGPAHTQRRAR